MPTRLVVPCLVLVGCATGTAPSDCATEFAQSICLDLSAAGSLVAHRSVIEEEVARTLDAVQSLLTVDDLRISLIADPTRIIPEVGMGGFNPSGGEVQLFADPSLPNLESVLQSELLRQLTHEIHHAMRRRHIGYGSTLLQAAVSEGLADHFSIEAAGGGNPPPWALALTSGELVAWIPEVVSRATGTYNHATWFFGADASIPRWTGYSVGFELVRAYLDQDAARSASALVGEPASSFLPYSP